MDISDYVNELPPSSRLGSLAAYLREEELESPVDMYLRSVAEILKHGTQQRLAESDLLGRLLLIAVISAGEAYFRAVLAACIELCPVSQSIASKQSIHLGGLLWHGRDGFSRSAFEHASFTSKEELATACKKFLGMPLEDQVFKSILDEFENVCQLRHGIVHGDGLLPGRNAILLNIPRYRKPVRIIVGYEQLQDVASVINTLIMTFNRQLFSVMCRRWAIDWRKREDWQPEMEKKSFSVIWNLFHSVEEAKRRKGRDKRTEAKCYDEVRALYNL